MRDSYCIDVHTWHVAKEHWKTTFCRKYFASIAMLLGWGEADTIILLYLIPLLHCLHQVRRHTSGSYMRTTSRSTRSLRRQRDKQELPMVSAAHSSVCHAPSTVLFMNSCWDEEKGWPYLIWVHFGYTEDNTHSSLEEKWQLWEWTRVGHSLLVLFSCACSDQDILGCY
jgi:hypothetical protein